MHVVNLFYFQDMYPKNFIVEVALNKFALIPYDFLSKIGIEYEDERKLHELTLQDLIDKNPVVFDKHPREMGAVPVPYSMFPLWGLHAKNDNQTETIRFKVSVSDYEYITKASQARGLKLADFCRQESLRLKNDNDNND